MMVDWLNFTPWSALLGGVTIGIAAAILFLGIGRIAGISGIVGGLLQHNGRADAWRWLFLVGLLIAPWLYILVQPFPEIKMAIVLFATQKFATVTKPPIPSNAVF